MSIGDLSETSILKETNISIFPKNTHTKFVKRDKIGKKKKDKLLSSLNREKINYLSFSNLELTYLEKRSRKRETLHCGLLKFTGGQRINNLTGYNASQPIYDISYDSQTGKPYFILCVRMERKEDEKDSYIEYFRSDSPFSKVWDHIDEEDLAHIKGQDPSVAIINNSLLLGVVEVKSIPIDSKNLETRLTWKMAFYKGHGIRNLEFFAYGPDNMKDIRLTELENGKILCFTRPQSPGNIELGGLGQIGIVSLESINDLKDVHIFNKSRFINTRFLSHEWGGINYAIALTDNKIGVIGHIARFDEEHPSYQGKTSKPKIYSPFSAIYNSQTLKLENVEILTMADEFSGVSPKTDLLKNVAYGTGITDPDDRGNVMLILGVGDTASAYKIIKDPFDGLRLTK